MLLIDEYIFPLGAHIFPSRTDEHVLCVENLKFVKLSGSDSSQIRKGMSVNNKYVTFQPVKLQFAQLFGY